jgi:uncharacterized protein YjbI with pentapeptide repeats
LVRSTGHRSPSGTFWGWVAGPALRRPAITASWIPMTANLSGASLKDANLQGSNLTGANLKGADLQGGLLQGASLQ